MSGSLELCIRGILDGSEWCSVKNIYDEIGRDECSFIQVSDEMQRLQNSNNVLSGVSNYSTMYRSIKIALDSMVYKSTMQFINESDDLINHESRRCRLIAGQIQSGKTRYIISYSIRSLFLGVSTIILVMRTYESESQLRNRFIEYKRRYNQHMRGLNLGSARIPDPISSDNYHELKNLVCGKTPGIAILLCNSTKLKRLAAMFETGSFQRYNLIIDEIDSFCKSSDAKFADPLATIIANSQSFTGVTGTIFDATLPIDINYFTNHDLYTIPLPDNYRGFESLQHTEIADDKSTTVDDWIDKLTTIVPFTLSDQTIHPIICLYKSTRENTQQLEIMYRHIDQNSDICTIVYNGIGIYLYYKPLINQSVCVNGIQSDQVRGKYVLLFKRLGISAILGWLIRGVGIADYHPPTHIMIISGMMADRGTSFVSDDYRWHLTHEILVVSATSTSATLLQSLRICGCYNDNIPLVLVSTRKTYNDCSRSHAIQLEIYKKSVEMTECTSLNVGFGKMVFDDDIVPHRRKLTTLAHKKINIVFADDVVDTTKKYRIIDLDRLNPQYHARVLEIIEWIVSSSKSSKWVLQSLAVSQFSQGDSELNNEYRTMFKNIRDANSDTTDDNTRAGFILYQKPDSKWCIRYNEVL